MAEGRPDSHDFGVFHGRPINSSSVRQPLMRATTTPARAKPLNRWTNDFMDGSVQHLITGGNSDIPLFPSRKDIGDAAIGFHGDDLDLTYQLISPANHQQTTF